MHHFSSHPLFLAAVSLLSGGLPTDRRTAASCARRYGAGALWSSASISSRFWVRITDASSCTRLVPSQVS